MDFIGEHKYIRKNKQKNKQPPLIRKEENKKTKQKKLMR